VAAGAHLQQEIKEVSGGRLIAAINGTDGNIIGLLQDPGSRRCRWGRPTTGCSGGRFALPLNRSAKGRRL